MGFPGIDGLLGCKGAKDRPKRSVCIWMVELTQSIAAEAGGHHNLRLMAAARIECRQTMRGRRFPG